MKRCPALRELSSQHHHGLVLAKRAVDAAGTAEEEKMWGGIRACFVADLEPHFRIEERLLLPALEQAGEHDLVRRTLDDHAELRRLINQDGTQVMAEFAELLRRHIRFEERELFEAAQQKLRAADLDALADEMDH